ncbi:hypothetical protein [Clostridium sp.]|uniref:hypothetical protein n=1 Tax=Clostridium sp. TaxID=1506 RepID=UPI00284DE4E8|nr:hypothetical protein [Clostridium sp.]MDR3596921.1 hypothetical protein [Clostridium sp.]
MNIVQTILIFVVICAVILGVNALCKKFIFGKVRINKWIPLAIAIGLFVAQMLIGNSNLYVSSVFSILVVLFFLWFMDIMQTGGPKKKEKQIMIKPKAKPNRVKKNK